MKHILRGALGAVIVAAMAVGAPLAAAAPVAGWVYVNADTASYNNNVVVAIPYAKNGIPMRSQAKLYNTEGAGTPLVLPLPNAVGTTAGDHQVLLSSNKKLLFAVNQGSNSIAVFRVNRHTGALKPVAGSPFFSGGIAPVGLGYAHGVLVVANHGIIAPFNPLGSSPPGPSDLVSFRVSASGRLREVSSTAPDPDGLIDATIAPSGNEIVTSGFYPEIVPGQPFPTFSPQLIRSVTLSGSGALRDVQDQPFPSSFTAGLSAVIPPFIPPALYPLPFGIAFNPKPGNKHVYIDATVAGRVAVYDYSNPRSMTLSSSVLNRGPGNSPTAACWIAISANGKYLYDANSVSQNISVFAISADGVTLTPIEQVPLKSKGTDDALALDPSGRYLYILGNHDDVDSPRPEGITPSGIHPAPLAANYLDAYSVNRSNGRLREIAKIKLPIPTVNLPYGVETLKKS